jgi:uncharacterized metal-binding protein
LIRAHVRTPKGTVNCSDCEKKKCYTRGKDCAGLRDEIAGRLRGNRMIQVATGVEAEFYMKKTRIEELMIFSERMGYEHLGIAFCIGLSEEAKTLADILKTKFHVSSVCCKVCGIDKKEYGGSYIHESDFEASCNPVAQAEVLNREGTDLNVILGLCIGHDILFSQNSKAPVTTLVVKDRVLGHNPVAALYSRYYRNKLTSG